MMYNDVDTDLPPFNDPIDGEEIFLFSNTKTSSSTGGTSFLHEDDDEHLLRHQHNVAGTSSHHHLPVDVDDLLLNSNFLEQPNHCDQSEDPLFWNCKDISDDQLNEFLPQSQLNLAGNSISLSNSNGNSNCLQQTPSTTITNTTLSTIATNSTTQHNTIAIDQQQEQTISQIQHPQTIIPIQQQQQQQQQHHHQPQHHHQQLQHQTIAPLISQQQQQIHHPQQTIQHIRLQQQPDSLAHSHQATTNLQNQTQSTNQTIQNQQSCFQQPQQIIQHVDQYQNKWITLVQTNEQYQTFNAPPTQPQQQAPQQFFDKIPQALIQTDASTSTIQNPVGSVITTQTRQIILQQQSQPQQTAQQHVPVSQSQQQPIQALQVTQYQEQVPVKIEQSVPENENASAKEASVKQNKPKEKQTRLDCPYCKRSFSKNFDLQQHMRCHTGEKPFQCIVCGRGFAQKSNVKKHMQAHKVWPEGPNNAPILSNHSSARSRNNSASSSVGTPRDDECMQENESLQINDHSNINNNGNTLGLSNDRKNEGNDIFAENRYSCSYCQFNGRTYFELKSHLTIHKREKVFKCIVSSCGKTFSGSDLQGFLDHVTGHKDLIYHCHLCSGQFYSLDEFGEHQKNHSNAQVKRTSQAQSLPSNQQQNQVIRQANTSLRQQNQQVTPTQLQPQQNQRQYNQQQTVPPTQQQHQQQQQQHQQQQQQSNNQKTPSRLFRNARPKTDQKYFRCTKCMNRYTTQTALDHHLSISTHNFPCTECNKVFMCERYLRRHLNTHTAVQHVCTFCDKHFKTAAYLKMHSVVHTGEKPFRCNQCEAAFNRRDKLNRHKLTHETVKKFKCPFRPHIGCTKEFNRPDKLKAHVLTHSGIRPHPCDACSRTFSRLSRLREHKKLHHDNNNNNVNLKATTSETTESSTKQEMSNVVAVDTASTDTTNSIGTPTVVS